MIVTFCGHAQFQRSNEYVQKIFAFLEEKVGDQPADMYLGGYGEFDAFAYECCKNYKEFHPQISLILITPYLPGNVQIRYNEARYDAVLYPELENKPKRYAITYRNRYMVEQADYVVAYVSHDWGGAYQTYRYAQRKGKEIFNLVDLKE